MLNRAIFDGGGHYRFRDWMRYPLACGFSHRRFDLSSEGRQKELSLKSLRAFLGLLGIEESGVVIPEQIQSAHIEFVDGASRCGSLGCDGLITKTKGIALSVLSADCAPVFFYDKLNQIIGIAHVGWQGLKSHLPQKMVERIRAMSPSRLSSIRVGLGPTIRSCCYEVDREQEVLFPRHVHYRDGRSFLDLAGAIIEELINFGVRKEEISDSYLCPSCSNDRFYSWRRERTSGRTMSVIMMK